MDNKDVFSRGTFDPRRHSAVAIAFSEKMPPYGAPGSRGEDVALKHYVVGPNVPPPSLSVRRPATAPVPRLRCTGPCKGTIDPSPRFLDSRGKWVQDEVPALIADSQAQPLTATHTLTASLPGAARERGVRPCAAVHSYHDVSPVIAADMVRDADVGATVVGESTLEPPRTVTPAAMLRSQATAASDMGRFTASASVRRSGTSVGSVSDARVKSIESFWARQAGKAFNLSIPELDRIQELGQHTVPGSANARLVGSRWRYIQRPVDGDVTYTDYYGRCGDRHADYYGRAYNLHPASFSHSPLVGDSDYIKVQASMSGIHKLRTRPGGNLDATIVNGAPSRLDTLSVREAQASGRGLHRSHYHTRTAPLGERDLRPTWASVYAPPQGARTSHSSRR